MNILFMKLQTWNKFSEKKFIFLILSPFYSLCFLIPSQYFSTVSRHFSTIFNYCECIFPWNYFSVKKNPIFFTETSECIFPWNYFSNFHRIWISTSVWDLESSAVKFSLLIKKKAWEVDESIPIRESNTECWVWSQLCLPLYHEGLMKMELQINEFKEIK